MIFFLAILSFILPLGSEAMLSLDTSLSAGFYQDQKKNSHSSITYDFRFNQVTSSGYEIYLDFSANNDFVQSEWGSYPYQLYVTLPIKDAQSGEIEYRSRLRVGRQFLTEGFDTVLLDGVYLPFYLSSNLGLKFYGGGIHIPEETDLTFDDELYGAQLMWKEHLFFSTGPVLKLRHHEERFFYLTSLSKTFYALPLAPSILLRDEWSFKENKNNQLFANLGLTLSEKLFLDLTYAERIPDLFLLTRRNYLYSLFSISKVEGSSASLTYFYNTHLSFQVLTDQMNYSSPARREDGEKYEVSFEVRGKNHRWGPYLTFLKSYGGELVGLGGNYKFDLNDKTTLKMDFDVSKFEKINSIKATAYHLRGGVDYLWSHQWKTMLLTEIERSHLFEFDARGIVYANYYY